MGRMGSGALIADAIPLGVALGDRGALEQHVVPFGDHGLLRARGDALFDRNRLTGE
jgi:hypothetical protein